MPFLTAGLWIAGARLVARGALFVAVLIATRALDPAAFGAFSYVLSYLIVACLLGGLGLEQAGLITVAGAKAAGLSDALDDALRRIRRRGLAGSCLVGFVASLLVLPVLGAGSEAVAVGLIAALIGASIVMSGVLRGIDRPVLSVIVLEGGRGAAFLSGGASLLVGGQQAHVWTVTAAVMACVTGACAAATMAAVKGARQAVSKPTGAPPPPFPPQGHFLAVLVATNLFLWLVPVVLERTGPIEEVGLFNVTMQFPALISFLSTSLEMALLGKIAEAGASGRISALQPYLTAAARLVGVVVLPAALLLFLVREPLLAVYGETYRAAATAMGLAIIAQVVSVACGPAGYIVLLTGRERLNMTVMAASSLAGLLVLAVLAPRYGHLAAAIGFLVAMVFANLILAATCLGRLGIDPTLLAALGPRRRGGPIG